MNPYIGTGSSLSGLEKLQAIANMAYGIKGGEGAKGGAGRIGLVNGRVVKFNTHLSERLFGPKATDAMYGSCNALRAELIRLSREFGLSRKAVDDIRKMLDIGKGGELPAKKLLDRTVVAKVINTITAETRQATTGVWNVSKLSAEQLETKGIASRDDMSFATVTKGLGGEIAKTRTDFVWMLESQLGGLPFLNGDEAQGQIRAIIADATHALDTAGLSGISLSKAHEFALQVIGRAVERHVFPNPPSNADLNRLEAAICQALIFSGTVKTDLVTPAFLKALERETVATDAKRLLEPLVRPDLHAEISLLFGDETLPSREDFTEALNSVFTPEVMNACAEKLARVPEETRYKILGKALVELTLDALKPELARFSQEQLTAFANDIRTVANSFDPKDFGPNDLLPRMRFASLVGAAFADELVQTRKNMDEERTLDANFQSPALKHMVDTIVKNVNDRRRELVDSTNNSSPIEDGNIYRLNAEFGKSPETTRLRVLRNLMKTTVMNSILHPKPLTEQQKTDIANAVITNSTTQFEKAYKRGENSGVYWEALRCDIFDNVKIQGQPVPKDAPIENDDLLQKPNGGWDQGCEPKERGRQVLGRINSLIGPNNPHRIPILQFITSQLGIEGAGSVFDSLLLDKDLGINPTDRFVKEITVANLVDHAMHHTRDISLSDDGKGLVFKQSFHYGADIITLKGQSFRDCFIPMRSMTATLVIPLDQGDLKPGEVPHFTSSMTFDD